MPGKYKPDQIAMLAEKWLNGTITPEETIVFEHWYRSVSDLEPEILMDETPEELRERLYKAIARREGIPLRENNRNTYGRIALAACIALLAFCFFWWSQNKFIASPFTKIVFVHAGSHIRKVMLPDMSIVWLKPGANLMYPASFGNVREVSLKGEGLFEVSRDTLHVFRVNVGDYTATVLGTSFHIRQSGNRKDMELAVFTGKVKVSHKDEKTFFEPLLVLPDEKLLTSDPLAKKQVTQEENTEYTSGTGYNMKFSNTFFEEVARRIEQKFNIRMEGDLTNYASCRFTADLTGQDLDYTLKLITATIGARYELKEGIVLIKGGGCK